MVQTSDLTLYLDKGEDDEEEVSQIRNGLLTVSVAMWSMFLPQRQPWMAPSRPAVNNMPRTSSSDSSGHCQHRLGHRDHPASLIPFPYWHASNVSSA